MPILWLRDPKLKLPVLFPAMVFGVLCAAFLCRPGQQPSEILSATPVASLSSRDFPDYPWLVGKPSLFGHQSLRVLSETFSPPEGFHRRDLPAGSLGDWLRGLPLLGSGTPVRLHTGALKSNQSHHAAVVALDTGPANLQQCADAIIRLPAEHLFSRGRHRDIAFHFTSGDFIPWQRWRTGWRPRVTSLRPILPADRFPPSGLYRPLRRGC